MFPKGKLKSWCQKKAGARCAVKSKRCSGHTHTPKQDHQTHHSMGMCQRGSSSKQNRQNLYSSGAYILMKELIKKIYKAYSAYDSEKR